MTDLQGRIHSIQSMGTLDGPGVRFVVFLQGCNLRCGFCHNPDTHVGTGGSLVSAAELAEKATRYREYFGEDGGVTLTGGEPLLQARFARAFFEEAHARGMNTCLDTSGSILSEDVLALLSVTDRVLLDVKFTDAHLYRQHIGCEMSAVLDFLRVLNEKRIPTTLRQVILPTLNDTEESIRRLAAIRDSHACVDSVELLPFRKICTVKYEKMGIKFPLGHLPTPTAAEIERLYELLGK